MRGVYYFEIFTGLYALDIDCCIWVSIYFWDEVRTCSKLIGELDNFVKEGFTELLFRKTVGPLVSLSTKSVGKYS